MALRVLLADPWPIVRQAVRAHLEQAGIAVAWETADGEDAVALCRRHHPDVVILDFHLPRLPGLDVARQILQDAPATGVIFLTLYIEEPRVTAALQAGVRGYVEKHRAPEDLIPAIHAVAHGGVYLSPPIDHLRATPPGTVGGPNLRPTGPTPSDGPSGEMAASGFLPVPNYVVLPIGARPFAA